MENEIKTKFKDLLNPHEEGIVIAKPTNKAGVKLRQMPEKAGEKPVPPIEARNAF